MGFDFYSLYDNVEFLLSVQILQTVKFILYPYKLICGVCFVLAIAEQPNQPPPNQQQVPERVFNPKHNQVAILDENLRGIDDYQQIIRFLRRSRIYYAISTEIPIVEAYMQDF
ncbi:hypothetical protein Hanom_Chr16g01454211 [Helianthus anomalus]